MNTPLVLLVPLLALSIHTGFAADKDKPDPGASPAGAPTSAQVEWVRVRFVPDPHPKARQPTGISAWSALGPFDETAWAGKKFPVSSSADFSALGAGPGAVGGDTMLMAHVGIGDTFPVQDKDGHTLGEVFIAGGDDDHLLVEVRSKEGLQKIELRRDKVVSIQMAGSKFEFLFPNTSVKPTGKEQPATSKAMITVKRRL